MVGPGLGRGLGRGRIRGLGRGAHWYWGGVSARGLGASRPPKSPVPAFVTKTTLMTSCSIVNNCWVITGGVGGGAQGGAVDAGLAFEGLTPNGPQKLLFLGVGWEH